MLILSALLGFVAGLLTGLAAVVYDWPVLLIALAFFECGFCLAATLLLGFADMWRKVALAQLALNRDRHYLDIS